MQSIFLVSYALLWILVALISFAFLEVLRQIGQLRKQVGDAGALIVQSAMEAGQPLPELEAVSYTSLRPADWDTYLRTETGVVLVFSTRCSTCRDVAQDVTGYVMSERKKVSVVIIMVGEFREAKEFLISTHLPPDLVVIDEEGITLQKLGIKWTPTAMIVHNNTVGKVAVINDIEQIDGLLYSEEVTHAITR